MFLVRRDADLVLDSLLFLIFLFLGLLSRFFFFERRLTFVKDFETKVLSFDYFDLITISACD